MLNQIVLVGRFFSLEELDKNKAILTLAVPRTFKNAEGEYETDFLKCVLYNSIYTNTKEYCKKNDILGIKGHAESENKDNEMIIVAEKVTFLSNKKEE